MLGRGGVNRFTPPLPSMKHPAERSEEHTSELQSRQYPVCRLLLEKRIRPAPAGLAATDHEGVVFLDISGHFPSRPLARSSSLLISVRPRCRGPLSGTPSP